MDTDSSPETRSPEADRSPDTRSPDTNTDTDTEAETAAETLHRQSSDASGVDLGLLDELATGLAEVQSALERIDAGTYGRCEQCGEQIDDATLEPNPTTRYCAAHLPFAASIPEWQQA